MTKYPLKTNYFFACRESLAVVRSMANENSSSCFEAFSELVIDQSDVSRTKSLALLKAVGHAGRTFLQSVGFDRKQSSYVCFTK